MLTKNTPHAVQVQSNQAMTRRKVAGTLGAPLIGTLGVSWLAAACGEASVPAEAKKAVTIKYLNNLSPTHPESEARMAMIDEFNQTNTQKITVDLTEARAGNTNIEKLKTLSAGGSAPDLYWATYLDGPGLYTSGVIIEVEQELKKEKEWAKQRADMFPTMLETAIWAGKLLSIPGYTNNQGMIYNTGLLQQAGVAPPKQGWTWDDFKSTAQKFVRDGVLPLSMGWGHTWHHWLGTTGSRPVTKDARKITTDTPEMIQVMELWLDFLKRGIIQTAPDGKSGLFEQYRQARNDTVFEVQGPYRIATLRQANVPEFRTLHIPVHPVKKEVFAANGGHSLVVPKTTPEKQAAAALVAQWLNAPHAQAQVCIRSFSIPVSKAAQQSKELQDHIKDDPAFKGFVDLAPYGWRWPALPSQSKIVGAIQDNINAIMRQEIGIKAGLAKAQQEAQVLLDEDILLMK